MTELQAKIKKYLSGFTFFNDCDIEFGNTKYNDEIPEYARLIMGLSITKKENTDNEETK